MPDDGPHKVPLVFFRTAGGSEPVREWLKGLPEAERQAIGMDLLRAVAVAGRHAVMSAFGGWLVGSPDQSADTADRTSAALHLQGALCCLAWIHQENTHGAG